VLRSAEMSLPKPTYEYTACTVCGKTTIVRLVFLHDSTTHKIQVVKVCTDCVGPWEQELPQGVPS
jgi:hypothetical protein